MYLFLCAYLRTLRELEGLKKEISVHKKKEAALILSVQKHRRTTNSLYLQLDFEKMLSEIAAHLISLSGRQFDEGIGYALHRIGTFFAVDRCYLFHFSADGRTIGSTCQWQSAGAVPLLLPGTQNILVENMPWWARQIKSGGHVLVSDVNKLPPEAVIERELCLSRNICSFLHVPIHSKGQLIGFWGLDTARPQKNWPLAHLIHSGIVTEMLTNTLVRRQAEEAIQHLSFNDQLTGLYNRRFFEKELRVLDSAANLPLTLVIADVNGLKLTNDVFGHPTGDQLLQKAAGIIQKECRADDIIARIGGDEFAILLPKTSYEQAGLIVRRINRAIAAQQTGPLNLSISFGWATKQEAGEDITAIFKKADDSMYKSKLSESILTQHETIVTVINKLYEKNEREQEHSQRVSQICGDIGVALGLSRDDLNELRMAGLLHDLGKVTVGNCILDKPGPLTTEEKTEIERHVETGYRILSSVSEVASLAEYILAHHERWDGQGYPRGLKGEKIPLPARIIAIADSYDAMTRDRPYRRAMSIAAAIKEIKNNAGTQFDPFIARVFVTKVLRKEWALEPTDGDD